MRVASLSRLACVLVLVAACDHKQRTDQNPAADAWAELSTRVDAQVAALRQRQKELAARIGALTVPAGTEDVTLATTIAELQGGMVPADEAISQVEGAVKQGTADVNAALAQKNKIAAERAVNAARAAIDAAVIVAEPKLALLEPKVEAATQIMQRLASAIEAELAMIRRLSAGGGSMDFEAIEFRATTADFDFTHPGSKATLDRLVQLGAACPQIRFGITGHTSKEGIAARNRDLSLARAEAVRGYLVSQGVEPEKIVRTVGLGSSKTRVDEPDPGTAAEQAMDAGTLEMLRRKNRRVTIDVETSCAPPAPVPGAAAAQVPPTAPTAVVQPGAARPTVERPIGQPPH